MMRMNREVKGKLTDVKNECANYNAGYICSGVMIGKGLHQWIDSEMENKVCKVKKNEECTYFNTIVMRNNT